MKHRISRLYPLLFLFFAFACSKAGLQLAGSDYLEIGYNAGLAGPQASTFFKIQPNAAYALLRWSSLDGSAIYDSIPVDATRFSALNSIPASIPASIKSKITYSNYPDGGADFDYLSLHLHRNGLNYNWTLCPSEGNSEIQGFSANCLEAVN